LAPRFISLLLLPFASIAADRLPRHAVLGASVIEKGGVRINWIRAGSPAERGGLRPDDVIVSLDGREVQTPAEFVSRIKSEPTGRPIPFEIRRGGAELPLNVTLEAAPDEHDPQVDTFYESILVDGALRRTLMTMPKRTAAPRPAVLIIGGIGCYSIDNATDPQDAYMRLAHDLGRKGLAALRLEKSGIGDSQGPPCMTVDFASEMHSYDVALRTLERDPRVDSRRVYVFGHSIGSLIAPRLANSGAVAGVVVAEAVGRNWIEYELWNLRRQLELAGDPPEQVDAKLAVKEVCMHRLLIEKEAEPRIEKTEPACKDVNLYPAPASYLQQVAALNIAEPWTKLAAPLLAIYGTADFVTAEADHRRIVDIVNGRRPGGATLKLVDGMDHRLDAAGTPQEAYDMRVKQGRSGPYEERFSAAILEWLCKTEVCAAPGG
jgi:alpha-beta hydrolase superfamily lysophospholipase